MSFDLKHAVSAAGAGLGRRIWIAAGLVAALQSAVLLYMVANRVGLLSSGREMIVEVVPVDPRDIFRGDYVVLGYTFSGTGDMTLPAGTRLGDRIYATLKLVEGSKWDVTSLSRSYPDNVGEGQRVLRGVADNVWRNEEKGLVQGRVRYGIESYFVPEGTGRDLEKLVREKKLEAVLAVSDAGEAAIKALVIDGKRVHEEPLF